MDVLKFLRFKGFSEDEIYKELYGQGVAARDEFGLPCLKDSKAGKSAAHSFDEIPHRAPDSGKPDSPVTKPSPDPFVDKMKGVADTTKVDKVFEKKFEAVPATGGCKSWSQVVKETPPESPSFKLSFVPPPAGSTMVTSR
ncbi:hypothetical protein ACET3Z_021332 [Daucus carota]